MALVPCVECGNEISGKAAHCPKCGHPTLDLAQDVTSKTEAAPAFSELKFGSRPSATIARAPSRRAALVIALLLIVTSIGVYALRPQLVTHVFSGNSAPTAAKNVTTEGESSDSTADGYIAVADGDELLEDDGASESPPADSTSRIYGTWCGFALLAPDGRASNPDQMHVKFRLDSSRYLFSSMFVDNVHGPVNGWSQDLDCVEPQYEKVGNDEMVIARCKATGIILDLTSGRMEFKFGDELSGIASSDCSTSDDLAGRARTDDQIESSIEKGF